jgi:hypothetical protein
MLVILNIARKYLITSILAITTILVIVSCITQNIDYVYYNEIYKIKNSKFLSSNSIDLIILTVTGDKKFKNNFLSNEYKDLQIIHLLVLSGSNISILCHFISLIKKRDSLSSLFLILLSVTSYYCYIKYLHPVARALIFLSLYEYLLNRGYKYNSSFLFFFGTALAIPVFIYLDLSLSFLLSFIFSSLIFIYSLLYSEFQYKNPFLSKFLLFPIFMTVMSLPINFYFFNTSDIKASFVSNLLIVPFYDLLVFLMYSLYFLGFLDLPLSALFLLIDRALIIFIEFLKVLNSLV